MSKSRAACRGFDDEGMAAIEEPLYSECSEPLEQVLGFHCGHAWTERHFAPTMWDHPDAQFVANFRIPAGPGGKRVPVAALAGKTSTVLGDRNQPHTYTYIPDMGEGLAVLGEHPDAPGEIWHLPNNPQTRSTQELVDTIYHQDGQPRTRIRTVPPFLPHALALTSPFVRELLEMHYQFDEPFIVDSNKITTRLAVTASHPRPERAQS